MTAVQWDTDSLDWKGLSAGEISRRVLDNVQPGSIVLFHNAAEHTPEALGGIIESLLADGYTIVPIGSLLLNGEYTIDHNRPPARGIEVDPLSQSRGLARIIRSSVRPSPRCRGGCTHPPLSPSGEKRRRGAMGASTHVSANRNARAGGDARPYKLPAA